MYLTKSLQIAKTSPETICTTKFTNLETLHIFLSGLIIGEKIRSGTDLELEFQIGLSDAKRANLSGGRWYDWIMELHPGKESEELITEAFDYWIAFLEQLESKGESAPREPDNPEWNG